METWLQQSFPSGPGGVVIFTEGNSFVAFDPTQAATVFGSLAVPPTYAALSALPIASSGNWQRIFDQWKANGKVG